QEKTLRLREGDHAPDDRQRDLADVQVELAEAAMLPGAVRGLDVRHDRPVARPREDIRAVAVRAKHRDDTVAQDRLEPEGALVRRAGNESGGDAERIEERLDLLRRVRDPRLAAVVH